MIRDLFEQKPELKKIILMVLLSIIVIIVGIIILSSLKSKKLTYEQLENKMKNAAVNYYKNNENKLPTNGNSVTINYSTLQESENLKSIDTYVGNKSSCTGKVIVKNNNDKYSYTAYLDCGSNYKTTEFYEKVLNDNKIIITGSGLYNQGNSKVFRGENINNFVKIDDNLWRIIKIDNDNSIKLVLYESKYKTTWDNRYNSDKKSSVGKNNYILSRIKETIDDIYDNNTLLNSDIKSKLISKPLCIGSRSEEEIINNGSVECSETIEGQYIGVLTVSEYINASLDELCKTVESNECQNYNYLKEMGNTSSWWLLTPVKKNTHQAYYVESYGSIEIANCSSTRNVRPTIYLGSEVTYVSGSGTIDDPYIIN